MFDKLERWFAPYAMWLYQVASANGLQPRVTSVYRSATTQRQLYQRYLSGQSTLPAAPPGRSLHQYGLAFDMVTTDAGNARLGALWKRIGGGWSPTDYVHFQALP